VGEVVKRATKYGEVIVVDDGSTDGTAETARSTGARVISHPRNLGYSASLRTGYLSSDREVIATIDADIQQIPEELPLMVSPILADEADMVIGSKFLGRLEYKPNVPNLIMDKLVCAVIEMRFDVQLTNAFSGIRAMKRNCIDFSYLRGNRHEGGIELDVSFAWHGYRIVEVPRTARRRGSGRSSIRTIDGWRILWRLFTAMMTPPKEAI
jgi:glycosyltransferase involved in cell wall biosynthesis